MFYAVIFFLIALVAGLAGFNDIAPAVAAAARVVCYAAAALGVISLVLGIRRR